MQKKLHNSIKQKLIFGGVFLLAFFQLWFVVAPSVVFAAAVHDAPAAIQRETLAQRENVKFGVREALVAGTLGAAVNAVSYFTRKFAYDSALYIANGGKGESALVYQDGFGRYLEKTALDAAASGISEFGEAFGLDLCSIPDLNISAFLQIGLSSIYGVGGPQPDCSFQDLRQGWSRETFESQYGRGASQALLRSFSGSVQLTNTDFGIALTGIERIDNLVAEQKLAKQFERLEGQGIKAITGLISDDIYTPAQYINQELKALTPSKQNEYGLDQIAGVYGSSFVEAVLPNTIQVFLNTLTTELLSNAIEGLFKRDPEDALVDNSGTANFFDSGVRNNEIAAQNAFSFLITRPPIQDAGDFNIPTELSACPPSPSVHNCVIDEGLRDALTEAKNGTPLTIKEALERPGYLNGQLPLISPRRPGDNQDPNCRLRGYCYSNVQKLRRLRVLPLGFEIAALKADPDRLEDWTLERVVAGYNDCDTDGAGNPIPSPVKPYCNLINPNWILRAPAAQCELQGFGSELVGSNTGLRKEECFDVSTCVLEGPNGECLRSNGFCTKEKNVWRIPGKSCQEQYASCLTYTDQRSGEKASYLSRTVDFAQCNAGTVGCRAYSLDQEDGEWVRSTNEFASLERKEFGRNTSIFFNERVVNSANICTPQAEGCSAFFPAEESEIGFVPASEPIYFKKAPDYLGCYDTNPNTFEVEYPETLAQIATLPQNEACGEFAVACIPEEVGCNIYSPVQGGPSIPGIIGNNGCPAECVGYSTYKQVGFEEQDQGFEPEQFPLHFIPDNAQVCPATFAGCDEFTNIDEFALGGESLEYYTSIKYCEKPTNFNQKTFYTWEGSANEGFSLKVHTLRPLLQEDIDYISNLPLSNNASSEYALGSPAYADDSVEILEENYDLCNEVSYNNLINNRPQGKADPDCRAFFDNNAEVYYRLQAKTISVEEACHPLRKTNNYFVADANLNNQSSCEARDGFWDGASCQKCTGGGKYDNGSCIYFTISRPGEGESCRGPASNPEAYSGCRTYVGNTGNNVFQVFGESGDSFEPSGETEDALVAAHENWSPVDGLRVVAESPQVGLYSLQVGSNIAKRTIEENVLENNGLYEISFWARGSVSQSLDVYFEQDGGRTGIFTFDSINNNDLQLSLGNVWREYRLGPITFTGSTSTPVELVFERGFSGNEQGPYFIDNVRLTQVNDQVHLIRESWKTSSGFDVPLACDSTPNDPFPGEMLGCSAYNASGQSTLVYATGFDRLCREEAVGCLPVYDTFNTIDETLATAYNVFCDSDEPGECVVLDATNGLDLGSCVVEPGQIGCYIEQISIPTYEHLAPENINVSTIFVPADTPIESPVYLAAPPSKRCDEGKLGCQKIALEEQIIPDDTRDTSFSYNELFILNNPDNYVGDDRIICNEGALGCGVFGAGNELHYFKDPKVSGNKLCYYKDPLEADLGGEYGWFKTGVGSCSNAPGQLCKEDLDCGEGNTCENIGNISCYPGYLDDTRAQGIWSNESNAYQGYVGTCPAEQNLCTELIDPADQISGLNDTDSSNLQEEGESYYVIYDNKVTDRIGECDGEVSLSEGCVLFNRTDRPNLIYSTEKSYENSENDNFGLVPAVNDGFTNDANVILKVDRDRTCSEWLACRSSAPVFDENGNATNVCYEYGICREGLPGDICTNWVDEKDTVKIGRLSESEYIRRDTSWYGEDLTGYSILGQYPIANFTYLTFSKEDGNNRPDIQYLAYKLDDSVFDIPTDFDDEELDILISRASQGCQAQSLGGVERVSQKPDWAVCGFDNGGRCIDEECIYPIDKRFPDEITVDSPFDVKIAALTKGECKAYPEDDSPFPLSVIPDASAPNNSERIDFTTRGNLFAGGNICQTGNCSCEYLKIQYENGVIDYWPSINEPGVASAPDETTGICSGGLASGDICVVSEPESCGEGTCERQDRREEYIGHRGYCLERDLSHPTGNPEQPYACLTWLPIDASASGVDVFNSFESAGYFPGIDAKVGNDIGGEAYCTDALASDQRQLYSEFISEELIPNGFSVDSIAQYNFNTRNEIIGRDSEPSEFDDGIVKTPGEPLWLCDTRGGPPECVRGVARDYNYTCGSIPDGPGDVRFRTSEYSSAFCLSEGLESVEKKYTLLNTWAGVIANTREQISDVKSPPTILRIETYDIKGSAPSAQTFGNIRDHIGFAPASHVPTNYVHMHPPLPWGQEDAFENTTPGNSGLYYHKNQADIRNSFSSIGHAPGDVLGISFLEDRNKIWRSPAEDGIKESELDRVYFVPLAYTAAGAHDRQPSLGSSAMYIDFSSLNPESPEESVGYSGKNTVFITNDHESNRTSLNEESDYNFEGPHTSIDGVYSYVISRDGVNDHLQSYFDYQLGEQAGHEGDGSLLDDFVLQEPRNRINRRYVIVFTNVIDPLVDNQGVPIADPFTIAGSTFGGETMLAIGMDFNEDGDFLGYISRWIQGRSANGIQMGVAATFKTFCTEYATVYDDSEGNPLFNTTNKAWTQRVWNSAVPEDVPGSGPSWSQNNPSLPPYGSLTYTSEEISEDTDILKKHIFYNYVDDNFRNYNGAPYACRSLAFGDHTARGDTDLDGINLGCISTMQETQGYVDGLNIPNVSESGLESLQQLFAAAFTQVKFNKSLNLLDETPNFARSADVSDSLVNRVQGLSLVPPQIYSLNPVTCFEDQDPNNCSVGERYNITVNQRNGTLHDYDRDGIVEEDINNNGQPETIIAEGSYQATVRFFAHADDNRMPIRKVAVDWSDGSFTNEDKRGLYKNRKPYCDPQNGTASVGLCGVDASDAVERGITCNLDNDCPVNEADLRCIYPGEDEYVGPRFGNAPRACTNQPFTFIHGYSCDERDDFVKSVAEWNLTEEEKLRLQQKGITEADNVCVFVPKVQVQDNWDWCNGVNEDGTPNEDGYQDAPFIGDKNCTGEENDLAWTSYNGKVIVIPKD